MCFSISFFLLLCSNFKTSKIRRTHTLTQRRSFIESSHSSTQNFICKSFSLTHMMLNLFLFFIFFLDIYLVVSVVELPFVCDDMQYIEERKKEKTNEQVKFETNFVALCKERSRRRKIYIFILLKIAVIKSLIILIFNNIILFFI